MKSDSLKSRKKEIFQEKLEIIYVGSELYPVKVNPEHLVIQIAGFADCFIMSFKDIHLFFDMGRMENFDSFLKTLKESFDFSHYDLTSTIRNDHNR